MKSQSLFSREKEKNISKCHLLKFLTRHTIKVLLQIKRNKYTSKGGSHFKMFDAF